MSPLEIIHRIFRQPELFIEDVCVVIRAPITLEIFHIRPTFDLLLQDKKLLVSGFHSAHNEACMLASLDAILHQLQHAQDAAIGHFYVTDISVFIAGNDLGVLGGFGTLSGDIPVKYKYNQYISVRTEEGSLI